MRAASDRKRFITEFYNYLLDQVDTEYACYEELSHDLDKYHKAYTYGLISETEAVQAGLNAYTRSYLDD